MSLCVWLPFTDGTLKQQGLKNATATIDGTVGLTDAGKLGKCATIGTAAGRITLPASTMTSFTECSVAFWIKIISWNTSYATFFQAGLGSTAWSHYIFGILRNNANSNLCFTLTNSSGSSSSAAYTTSNLNIGQWYHLAFTYKAGTICTYIDGILDKTYSTTYVPNFAGITNISIGKCTNNSNYQTNCNLNDVRIYDHCLSPMEVKELAKGLVLHYPFSDPSNDEKRNLMPQNYWTGTKTLSLSANTTNYGVINYPAISVKTDTSYFWTVDFRILSGGNNLTALGVDTNCSGGSYTGNDSAHTVITVVHPSLTKAKAGEWQTAYCITKTKSDATNPTIFHTIYGQSSVSTNLIIEWRNFMLVESTEIVPFRAWHNNIIYDCSGFCNNGTILGTLNTNNDTAKYRVSTYFNGSSYIQTINNVGLSGDLNLTISFWIKADSFTNDYAAVIWNGYSGTNLAIAICVPSGKISLDFWNNRYLTNNVVLTPNNWCHVCCTKSAGVVSSSNSHIYVNGQEVTGTANNYSTTAPNISGSYKWIIGRLNDTTSRYITGKISDVRVYATALSADDVKSLYQNSAYIDSSGNVYGAVHTEV